MAAMMVKKSIARQIKAINLIDEAKMANRNLGHMVGCLKA